MLSAVCSVVPHSQFENGTRPHLCIDEEKHQTTERTRSSLIQNVPGKTHTHWSGADPVYDEKLDIDIFSDYSMFHFVLVLLAA